MADIDIFGDDPIEKPIGDNTQAGEQEKGREISYSSCSK